MRHPSRSDKLKTFLEEDCEWDEDPVEQAMEWIDYNVIGSYVGKYTPIVVHKDEEGNYESDSE